MFFVAVLYSLISSLEDVFTEILLEITLLILINISGTADILTNESWDHLQTIILYSHVTLLYHFFCRVLLRVGFSDQYSFCHLYQFLYKYNRQLSNLYIFCIRCTLESYYLLLLSISCRTCHNK